MAVNDEQMVIFPEPGQVKDVAKLLLQLADHPGQVATTLDPTIGFKIPLWLYELFVQVWDLRPALEAKGLASTFDNIRHSSEPISDEFIAQVRAEATPDQQEQLDKFVASRDLAAQTLATLAVSGPEVVTPAKRKPGRPRKEVK